MAFRSLTKFSNELAVVDAKPAHTVNFLSNSSLRGFAHGQDAQGAEHAEELVERFLRSLQIFLRSAKLYRKNHPRLLENLETADRNLRAVLETLGPLALGIERRGIYVPKFGEMPLADPRQELAGLAEGLSRSGITSIVFYPETNQGELDTLVLLVNTSLLRSEVRNTDCSSGSASGHESKSWAKRLAEHHVTGIAVNTHIERKVDSVLASLISAMVAYGGPSRQETSDSSSRPVLAPTLDELAPALRLLARLTPPLEIASGTPVQEAARALHATLAEAERDTVRLLVRAITHDAPRDGEHPQPYLIRLSETLIFQFIHEEFLAGRLKPVEVRALFDRLGDDLVSSGGYTGPHSSAHLTTLAAQWANERYRESLVERFWKDLPPREKSSALRSSEVWCVPVAALRPALEQLAEAGADVSRREARLVFLNYAHCLKNEIPAVRHQVAAGLSELQSLAEQLWPHQLPEELGRGILQALGQEEHPEIAALLAALTENLARLALVRCDFLAFDTILTTLERAVRDTAKEHLATLATGLVAQDRWLLLVDAALENRALDPALPRLLLRDPERVLDRLTLLLTEPQGLEVLPAMARLLRAMGVPVLGLLETRLFEARRQRATAAVKLLAATDPERLARCLPRALPSWDWSLQDLAVSELARLSTAGERAIVACAFLQVLADANAYVVPMMIDQIGLAREFTAVPELMNIASGRHETLRDLFFRIKSIEALGRMRAEEASPMLREISESRSGLSYMEPAGLRAAAEEALALLEERPASARVRMAYEAGERTGTPYTVQRRYARIPLVSPLKAQIEGLAPGAARVRTISLGGAYLESDRRFAVGDSFQVAIRSGFRRIHTTAVVRNTGPEGGGVEFVLMKQDDREKLRRLVHRHLQA